MKIVDSEQTVGLPMISTRRSNTKSNLQTLNNRFAMYTRKVRALEDQNEALLIELAKYENKTETDWDEVYRGERANIITLDFFLKN